MERVWWTIPLFLFFVSCGKNTGFYTTNPNFPVAAPPPGNSPLPPPSGIPVVQYPFPGGPGSFNPGAVPPGLPPQFTPFLPLWQYFQQSQSLQGYWSSFWYNWQQFAYSAGYGVYDFIPFWYEYCPMQWQTYSDFYQYFNYNVYSWLSPNMMIPSGINASMFWQNYAGFPYSPMMNIPF